MPIAAWARASVRVSTASSFPACFSLCSTSSQVLQSAARARARRDITVPSQWVHGWRSRYTRAFFDLPQHDYLAECSQIRTLVPPPISA
jgi:hypothetical protein